jgi:hypothetical protein
MKWEDECSIPTGFPDVIYAEEIICIAYSEGLIDWNVFKMALDKIKSNKNGNWMFDKTQEDMLP